MTKSYGERLRGCSPRKYKERVQQIAQESYPEVARLEQVKGVGTLIALTYVLTLEDPERFRKSRDVGCYLGIGISFLAGSLCSLAVVVQGPAVTLVPIELPLPWCGSHA